MTSRTVRRLRPAFRSLELLLDDFSMDMIDGCVGICCIEWWYSRKASFQGGFCHDFDVLDCPMQDSIVVSYLYPLYCSLIKDSELKIN